MRFFALLILMVCMVLTTHAQQLLQGTITDDEQELLVGATVVLLEPVDSTIVAFAISDSEGTFTLEDIHAGDYVLQVSYVSYKTLQTSIKADGKERRHLGVFSLSPSSEVLQEVTVKAEHIPMGVIGDTISYNAAAFKTKPGATVEDLLKKLPGVEVQRDGSIKAMGEDVNNVLVDGKEFFGDDPKIATKNLDAEAVDKVQVFDKKSEIAEFTGIEDGNEEKTINLKLKEGYKKGGFGTVALAGGTESIYDGKLNYNRFSPKMQAAVILSGNNINKQAFSFNEYIDFMGGIGNAIANSNSGMNFSEFGGRAPQGITDHVSGGLNFNYDFSSKFKLTSHYFYTDSDQNLEESISSQQFAESATFQTVSESLSDRLHKNHRFQANLEYKPNPFTQLKWKNTLTSISNQNEVSGTTEFLQLGTTTGFTSSLLSTLNHQKGVDGRLVLRKKYAKKGRSWMNTAVYQIGTLNEENDIDNQIKNATSPIDVLQNQFYMTNKNNVTLESAYTEPLSGKVFLSARYSYDHDREAPERLFFDIFDETSILNDELTRSYEKINTVHKGQIGIRRNTKDIKMSGGVGFQSSQIQGAIRDEASMPIQDINSQSFHILPQLDVDVDLSRNSSLDLSYTTSVTLPNLQQLAPLPNNTNPNVLVVGNPELVPSYTHNIGLNYRSIDQFNFKNFFAHLNLQISNNQVINSLMIDADFIRTIQPVNSDKYTGLQSYFSYSSPIRPLKLKFTSSVRVGWSAFDTFINENLSGVNETNSSLSFTIENRKKENFDLAAGVDLILTDRKYDINEEFNQSFFNYSTFLDGVVYLGDTWAVTSKYDYRFFSGEFFAESQKFHLWHLSLKKSFDDGKFSLSLSVNDILDQTRGVERSGGLNSLYDLRFNTRSRYVSLGLKVKLGKKKRTGFGL